MKNTILPAALTGMLALAFTAQAQTVFSIVHASDAVSGTTYNNGVSFLDRFTVTGGAGFTIKSVGLYNNIGISHSVSVYKNGVFSQTISGATGASGGVWKYANLATPINVGLGDYIDVFFTNISGQQNYAYAPSGGNVGANFSVANRYMAPSGTYDQLVAQPIYGNQSVSTLSSVPEPAEWTVLASLAAGVAGVVIRRRQGR